MHGSALSSRFGRALILLVVAAAAAAGLVLAGAGQPPHAHAAVSPGTTQLVSVDPPVPGSAPTTIRAANRGLA